MVTEYLEKQECCGCMLCVEICPKNAIFEKRVSGFSFPEINRDKCIGCKKCVESCPVINSATLKAANPTINFDIASNKSLERIQCSSSGGVFIELASEIIQGGGYCIWS